MRVTSIKLNYNGAEQFALPFVTPQAENAAIRTARRTATTLLNLPTEPVVQPTTRKGLFILKHPVTRAEIGRLTLTPAPQIPE